MKMKKVIYSLTLVATMILAGCATALVSPITSSVPAKTDSAKIPKAILAGAIEKGWSTKQISPNIIQLTLHLRQHMVVVNVTYSETEYAIGYKDSTNMNYNPEKNTIHSKYGTWVENLRRAIDKYLIL